MCDCTPALSPVNGSIKATVDTLYKEAICCEEFYSLVRDTFGSDERAPQAIDAFSYARSKYWYLSPSEQAAEELAEDEDVCRHGLDVWTCPAGCFEG